MTVLAGLAGLLLLVLAVVALRRPLLARMAARGAVRRKGETLLVILGSLLGTAIITSSLLVGDTLDASFRATVPNQLGPTDLVVRTPDAVTADEAANAITGLASDDIDGVLRVRTASAAVATPEADDRLAQPSAQLLEVDFGAAAEFGGDPQATGISGPTPAEGTTVLAQDLADELSVGVGDAVQAYVYGDSVALTVDRIVPRRGVAGFWTGFEQTSMNAFVTPGTLQALYDARSRAAAQAQPPSDQVLVSATGGVFEGADLTETVTDQVTAATAGVGEVDVTAVKQTALDAAEVQGDVFGQLFLAIGSFAVLAGLILLVNLFVMLAEERKSELGMLRAIGLKRGDLVRLFLLEGTLYSLAASVAGALIGIGLARIIIAITASIFSSFGAFTITFSAPPLSVLTGFLAGLVIALLTIAATSLRISRVNIIRAIRELPEPTERHRRPWITVLQLLGALLFAGLSVAAIATESSIGALAAPAITALFLTGLLGFRVNRRLVVTGMSSLVLAWTLFADRFVEFADGDINLFIVQGVVLTGSAVALVGQNQDIIGAGLRRLGGSGNLVTRLGVAYPLARRFRTSMTLAMYSLVVFTLVFISVLSGLIGGLTDEQVAGEGGGFDVRATASLSNPLPPERLEAVEGVAKVATLTFGGALFRLPDGEEPVSWGIAGFDEKFVAGGPPGLLRFDEETYADETAVWRAVLEDPSLAVVDAFFAQEGGGPRQEVFEIGDTLEVRDPTTGQTTRRTIAGLSDSGLAFNVWMSKDSVADAVAVAVPARYYLTVEEGASAVDVAGRLQGEFVGNGVQADTFRALVEENSQANTQFFRLMQGYLALGLIVGIAGLGVIMVRAVRERRREIGMLRSIGFQAPKVRAMFLFESGFIALEGILIGTALALVTSYQITVNAEAFGDLGATFRVPWGQLAVLLGTALGASLLATAAPASQAARIRPATALRIAD